MDNILKQFLTGFMVGLDQNQAKAAKVAIWFMRWIFIPLITPFLPLFNFWILWMVKHRPETLKRWISRYTDNM